MQRGAVELFLPCAGGTEALLAAEVQAIVGRPADSGRGGVWIRGDAGTAMALNLHSRLAQRVLWPLVDRDVFGHHAEGSWRGLESPQSIQDNTSFLGSTLFLEFIVELPEQSRQRLYVGANGSLVGHI